MQYVIREDDVQGYSPQNHSGTVNRRIIGKDNGAKYLEVVVGTLAPGASADAHAHPGIEQVVHILERTGEGEVDGKTISFGPGDWVFLPEGSFHDFRVTSDQPMRLIVIYAPPYSENKDAVIVRKAD